MPDELPLIEDWQVLEQKLRDILVEGPLYRNFVYTGRQCHLTNNHGAIGRPRYGLLPQQLKMYCGHDRCSGSTWWDCSDQDVYFGSGLITQRYYTCRNCGASRQHYQFIWQENEDGNIFAKVGQYPPLSIEPTPELAEALGSEDAQLYKKGLINFQFGHGIGAVAYFRRVLENKINSLLDLIAEAARNENAPAELIAAVDAVKLSHRAEDKIAVASQVLPAHLKPGGHNPFDKLYAPLSAGLHGESDDQCLTTFADAKFVFEYLFKNLTESNEEAREYVKHLSAPASKTAASNARGSGK
jgi:hypothetical protein